MRFAPILSLAYAGLASAQMDLLSILESQSDLSTLLTAIQLVPGLADTLAGSSDITILAPTNSAFEAVPNDSAAGQAIAMEDVEIVSALLAYHVLDGSYPSSAIVEVPTFVKTLFDDSYEIDGAPATNVTGGENLGVILNGEEVQVLSGALGVSTVTEADIMAQGGIIIHKIDTVLTLPESLSSTATGLGLSAAAGALVTADLVSMLDVVPDLTIFVPNNEAFQAIGSAFAGAPPRILAQVLQYHAVTGSVVFSPDVTNTSVPSALGPDLYLSVVDGTVFVNTARVVIPNIILSNGVMHVIDAALNPDTMGVDRGSLDPDAPVTPAFSASSVSITPFATAAPSPTAEIDVPAVATTATPAPPPSMAAPPPPAPDDGAFALMASITPAAIAAGLVGGVLMMGL